MPKTAQHAPWRVHSQPEVAAAFGVSASTVKRWGGQGMPREDGGGYDLLAIAEWRGYRAGLRARIGAEGQLAELSDEDIEQLGWDARKLRADALRAELRLQAEQGQHFSREHVEEVARVRIQALMVGLRSLPARWAMETAGRSPAEAQDLAEREIDGLLAAYGPDPSSWLAILESWRRRAARGAGRPGPRRRGRPQKPRRGRP